MHLLIRYARPAAILWLLIASFLFCLPGSTLPKAGWLSIPHIDKWVHVGIFTLLTFFWGIALPGRPFRVIPWLLLAAVGYGYGVEVVQDQFIANRSFDLWDLAADSIGALLGLTIVGYIKNKPL